MSKLSSKTLDDQVYAILTDHLGEPWKGVWERIRNSFEDEDSMVARAIKNRVWALVITRVFVEVKGGKTTYYDKSLIAHWEVPLEFGQLFVNPISDKLAMVGYDPSVEETNVIGFQGNCVSNEDWEGWAPPMPQRPEAKLEPRNLRIRQINERVFFCKAYDRNWYEVKYSFDISLKPEWFDGGAENYGHIDFMRRDLVQKDGVDPGYTKTLLSPEQVRRYSLPMAS